MLPKIQKLHLDKEFDRVFKTGYSAYGRFLGVKIVNNNLDYSRFAVILSNKISKSAVKRHIFKRQIFKCIKKHKSNLGFFGDCVIISLPLIKEASFQEIDLEIKKLFTEFSLKK